MNNSVYSATRRTSESLITVTLDFNEIKKDYRKRIKTGLPFLNHMIEQIVWRSGINLEIEVQLDEYDLAHLICEDVGITFGKAVAGYMQDNMVIGVAGFGDGSAIIDEAKATSDLSFESRTYFNIAANGLMIPVMTEGMLSEDLTTFLEGFAQGANCTLHVDLLKGHNGHHIWEAIFRSFGVALSRALAINENRKGVTSGVAGAIVFELEKK